MTTDLQQILAQIDALSLDDLAYLRQALEATATDTPAGVPPEAPYYIETYTRKLKRHGRTVEYGPYQRRVYWWYEGGKRRTRKHYLGKVNA